jgi:hypothetical protein
MIKRLIIILVILFKLLPGQQKSDAVSAQWGIEFDYGYWQEVYFAYGDPEFQWVSVESFAFYSGYSYSTEQEQQEWANYLNDYAQTALDEMNEWADQFLTSGWDENWNAQDWYEYLESLYEYNTNYPNTPPDSRYYIKTNGGDSKFYNGDTIYVPQRQGKIVQLTLNRELIPPLTTGLQWKQNDTIKITNTVVCNFDVSQIGFWNIKADSASIATRIQNVLVVYKQPTVYFKKKLVYNGEYGFDDSTHKYSNIQSNNKYKSGYLVTKMNYDTAYFVPWMSLLDKQTAIIRDSVSDMGNFAQKDRNGYIEFKGDNDSIVLTPSRQYYNSFATGSIQNLSVYAKQWEQKLDSLRKAGQYNQLSKSVYAITNTGDTIGKLNLSCVQPNLKKIVFIYVNIGTGYDSSVYKRTTMIDTLNAHSHNQMFRNWEMDTINNISDTLDITAEYLADSTQFFVDSLIQGKVKTIYNAHKGINLSSYNLAVSNNNATKDSWMRFAFIFPREFSITSGGTTNTTYGIFSMGGTFGCFFKKGSLKTVCHELAHALNNGHTFDPPFSVSPQTTDNIMDYLPPNSTLNLNKFWYCQWIETY